ncbi:MAG: hypothetical protein U0168_10595 [Nannocystaceae bacterium]
MVGPSSAWIVTPEARLGSSDMLVSMAWKRRRVSLSGSSSGKNCCSASSSRSTASSRL